VAMSKPALVPEDHRRDPAALARRNVTALARVIIAKAQAKTDATTSEAAILRAHWPDDRTAADVLKAASAPNSLTNTTALAAPVVSDLISAIGPTGAGARLLQDSLQLTFDRFAEIFVPSIEVASNQGSFVGEGAPIPVHDLLSSAATLAPRKVATIFTITSELVKASNAEALITDALLRAVGLALDSCLFDSAPADAVRPAGLRNGIAALTESTATAPDDCMIDDLTTLAGSVVTIGWPPVFVCSPQRAVTIMLRARPTPFPFAVYGSPAMAADEILATTPIAIASALAAMPEIDVSNVSTLHLDDMPLPIAAPGSPNVVAAPARGLLQTDAIGVRVRFDADWARRDPRAVSWLATTRW
jgi:hypothetical protein